MMVESAECNHNYVEVYRGDFDCSSPEDKVACILYKCSNCSRWKIIAREPNGTEYNEDFEWIDKIPKEKGIFVTRSCLSREDVGVYDPEKKEYLPPNKIIYEPVWGYERWRFYLLDLDKFYVVERSGRSRSGNADYWFSILWCSKVRDIYIGIPLCIACVGLSRLPTVSGLIHIYNSSPKFLEIAKNKYELKDLAKELERKLWTISEMIVSYSRRDRSWIKAFGVCIGKAIKLANKSLYEEFIDVIRSV